MRGADRECGRDQFGSGAIGTDPFGLVAQIDFFTLCHRLTQLAVSDEDGMVSFERGIAQSMVGMHMRVDDIQDGLLGDRAYRLAQLRTHGR
jgi:hypothetical protein